MKKKNIDFVRINDEDNIFYGYYHAESSGIQIFVYISDTGIDFSISNVGYCLEPRCNEYGNCKFEDSEKCDPFNCRNLVKVKTSDDNYMSNDYFDDMAYLFNDHEYEGSPIEKMKLAKNYLLRILNSDPRFLDIQIDMGYPKESIKAFENSKWNFDGVIV